MIASRALRLRASEPTCEKEGDESISDSLIIDGSLNTRYCLLDQDLFGRRTNGSRANGRLELVEDIVQFCGRSQPSPKH